MKFRKKARKTVAIFLSIGLLLTGCSTKPKDATSLPVLEISDSEKLPYNEWEDVPYSDNLATELQRIAAEMEIDSIEVLTYLRYSDNECMLTFDYKDSSAYGKFVLEGEEWEALFIANAQTMETYWATSEHEDLLPPYIKSPKDSGTHQDEPISSVDTELETLQHEAEELASKAKNIESGEFYNSVISIFPDAKITAMPDASVSILLNIEHTSVDEDSARFFEVAENICNNCNIENEYSDVSFLMRANTSFIGSLTLLHYESPNSFTSNLFINDSEYETAMKSVYKESVLCIDIMDTFDDALDDIAEKHNQ